MILHNIRYTLKAEDIRTMLNAKPGEEWERFAYPISAGAGVVILMFLKWNGKNYDYKFICHFPDTGKSMVMEENHLLPAGADLNTMMFLPDGSIGFIFIDKKDDYRVFYRTPDGKTKPFKIGRDLYRFMFLDDGSVLAGYEEVGPNEPCVRVFDRDGNCTAAYSSRYGADCGDLTVDEMGDIWFKGMAEEFITHVRDDGKLEYFPIRHGDVEAFTVDSAGEKPLFVCQREGGDLFAQCGDKYEEYLPAKNGVPFHFDGSACSDFTMAGFDTDTGDLVILDNVAEEISPKETIEKNFCIPLYTIKKDGVTYNLWASYYGKKLSFEGENWSVLDHEYKDQFNMVETLKLLAALSTLHGPVTEDNLADVLQENYFDENALDRIHKLCEEHGIKYDSSCMTWGY